MPVTMYYDKDADLSALKGRFQNGVVKIEFTAISNKDVTQLNPTKSEESLRNLERTLSQVATEGPWRADDPNVQL